MRTPTACDDLPPAPDGSRRRRTTRILLPFVAGLVVASLAVGAFVVTASSDAPGPACATDDDRGDERHQPEDTTTTTSTIDGGELLVTAGRSAFASGGPGASSAGAPQLETLSDIVLDPGIYERDLVLRNAGGTTLTWNATPEAGDVVVPSAGVIAAGSEVIVHVTADEYSTGSKNWTHTMVVHSDGGDAQIAVQGTTLLPPMPQIVGGTQVNQMGNVYVFDNGAINVGLQIKNEGDLPLYISFSTAAGARVQGDSNRIIEGGQTEFVAFSLCDQPAPVVATQIDVEMYIDAGTYGAGTLVLRFNQMAGQPTGPC